MKINEPANHIDHMLRQTRMHHVQLSAMADQKANMLLTMASLVVTLSIPQILKPEFRWPLLVLIGFSLITVSLAVYAVMPKFSPHKSKKSVPDVSDPSFDLLFFGDFTKLDYAAYESAMEEMMNNANRTYEVQVREIYALGTFLVRSKYRFLRLGYMFFLCGLFASLTTMFICMALQH